MKRLVPLLFSATLLAGCHHSQEIMFRMQPVDGPNVRISSTELTVSREKLWVKLQVQNTTQKPIIIQRDSIVVHLPSGQTLMRAHPTGFWGGGYAIYASQQPIFIPPGVVQPVNVEYEQQGFAWEDVPSVQLDFGQGVTQDGQPIAIPPVAIAR